MKPGRRSSFASYSAFSDAPSSPGGVAIGLITLGCQHTGGVQYTDLLTKPVHCLLNEAPNNYVE